MTQENPNLIGLFVYYESYILVNIFLVVQDDRESKDEQMVQVSLGRLFDIS